MAIEDGSQLQFLHFEQGAHFSSPLVVFGGYFGIPATISDSIPQWSSPLRILKYPKVCKKIKKLL